jgi:hypothetical protein
MQNSLPKMEADLTANANPLQVLITASSVSSTASDVNASFVQVGVNPCDGAAAGRDPLGGFCASLY